MEFKNWDGKSLRGEWLFTLKIDGIQGKKVILYHPPFRGTLNKGKTERAVSKGGKSLYHLPKILPKFEIAEIYCGNWNTTMSIVMASKSKRRQVKRSEIYPLYPTIDPRLVIGTFTDPDARLIRLAFDQAISEEYEGLVLRQGDKFIKIKPTYSIDVRVLGFVEGKGRFKGKLGKFITEAGEVGTGFNNKQRDLFWKCRNKFIGKIIEVEYTEMFKSGKLRNPRFIRLRPDKS